MIKYISRNLVITENKVELEKMIYKLTRETVKASLRIYIETTNIFNTIIISEIENQFSLPETKQNLVLVVMRVIAEQGMLKINSGTWNSAAKFFF